MTDALVMDIPALNAFLLRPSMFALADVGMYLAILARLGPVALAVTTNCSIDFMRKPAAGADLIAKTRILKLGRVLAVGDVLLIR